MPDDFIGHLFALPVRHENSKSMKLNLPIILQNQPHGEIDVAIDFSEMGRFFVLGPEEMRRLTIRYSGLDQSNSQPVHRKRDGLDLANRYAELLASGRFKTRAELARYLGVSRARVTQVLRRLKH